MYYSNPSAISYLSPERSRGNVRTRINITYMFKETKELCKTAHIMDKKYTKMGKNLAGGKIKIKVSPSNLCNIQVFLA